MEMSTLQPAETIPGRYFCSFLETGAGPDGVVPELVSYLQYINVLASVEGF